MVAGEPCAVGPSLLRVAVGARLLIVTIETFSESLVLRPSESSTLIATFVELGPSGKAHWKLPPSPAALRYTEPSTSWPFRPHCGYVSEIENVSWPGSVTV